MTRIRTAALTLVAFLVPGLVGCNLIAGAVAIWGKAPTRDVPAEYPYLAGKKVCVLVWADSSTLIEFQFLPLEISEHVTTAMKEHVKGISFVPNRSVVELQRREPDWDRKSPTLVGKRFGADRVLMIELTQYTTREIGSPHLYRGRISANVKVYDTNYPNSAPTYRTLIETVYPPDEAGGWGVDESEIRRAAMEQFATELANRFYDRKVKIE